MKLVRVLPVMLPFFICIATGYTQQKPSFQIIDKGNIKDVSGFEKTLANADFDKYRLKDKKRILEFEEGMKVAIFSWDEMESAFGIKAGEHFEVIMESEIVFHNKFAISPSGYIIEKIPVIAK